jgi:hypothetical protein
MRTELLSAIALTCALVSLPPAHAQDFPPDAGWTALRCGDAPMSDPVGDVPGAVDERDIVGDTAAPAGLRAVDDDYLYLRLRLDRDPTTSAGALRPFAWGFLFDLDLEPTSYELLIRASGADQTVSLFRNATTTSPDDPADPPDQPPAAIYDWADSGRSAPASSSFGGDADRFLELAIPWDDLVPLGLTPITRVRVWAATSSTGDTLDGDLACHDASSGRDPSLGGTGAQPTTPDPEAPGGGSTGEGELEGGGGCATGRRAGGSAAVLLLALLAVRRRPRSSPA